MTTIKTLKKKYTYRVVANSNSTYEIFVEAETEMDAIAIGESVDGNYWLEGESDWEVSRAEKEENVPNDKLLPHAAYNTL